MAAAPPPAAARSGPSGSRSRPRASRRCRPTPGAARAPPPCRIRAVGDRAMVRHQGALTAVEGVENGARQLRRSRRSRRAPPERLRRAEASGSGRRAARRGRTRARSPSARACERLRRRHSDGRRRGGDRARRWAAGPRRHFALQVDDVTCSGASSARIAPVGLIATRSRPARQLTLPAVPITRPSSASRRQASATWVRSRSNICARIPPWRSSRAAGQPLTAPASSGKAPPFTKHH